jgi:hypothetical protein
MRYWIQRESKALFRLEPNPKLSTENRKMKSFLIASMLMLSTAQAQTQNSEKPTELDRSEVFPPEDGKLVPLQGKISKGRYYSPDNVFSCIAYDFGEGHYTSQDLLNDISACVGFYDSIGTFKKAEVFFMPGIKKTLEKKHLRQVFDGLGIGILKTVDNAQGIEILEEEMVGEHMLFVAISIRKMSVLKDHDGNHLSSTRGYLVFQEKDKIVLLSDQEATLAGKKHNPKIHVGKLKKEILEFRNSLEFDYDPSQIAIQEKDMAKVLL